MMGLRQGVCEQNERSKQSKPPFFPMPPRKIPDGGDEEIKAEQFKEYGQPCTDDGSEWVAPPIGEDERIKHELEHACNGEAQGGTNEQPCGGGVPDLRKK